MATCTVDGMGVPLMNRYLKLVGKPVKVSTLPSGAYVFLAEKVKHMTDCIEEDVKVNRGLNGDTLLTREADVVTYYEDQWCLMRLRAKGAPIIGDATLSLDPAYRWGVREIVGKTSHHTWTLIVPKDT